LRDDYFYDVGLKKGGGGEGKKGVLDVWILGLFSQYTSIVSLLLDYSLKQQVSFFSLLVFVTII
jgi:hypothetical protein